MAKVDYLIKFDDDGNRGETHDAVFMTDAEIADYQAKGFIAVSTADYNNLLGNNADNQPYIRQADGTFVPKPVYVPTAAETQAAKLSELDNEYATKLEDNKNSIIVAATVDQDEEYANQLRQERQALQAEYVQKRSEL
ncbi:hypothetical protein CJ260_10300 [Megasphaera sp. ASD88]|uniref:hypothetical protein n=1 Tax=Megasphaera sp. ASD88 TaxID=2027407 RepID=UPI000BAB6C9C|nr:hypothetical protein [Megasphaera sp. ASD88]PAV38297.1 hypothetical protein CJ260_10300 [Megasphaera sp. ASD88]